MHLLDAKDTSFFRFDIFFESDIFRPETINCVLAKFRKAFRVYLYVDDVWVLKGWQTPSIKIAACDC
jgi:hypothetical protein